MKFYHILPALLLAGISVHAQNKLSGTISAHTGKPLEGAEIFVDTLSANTNAAGQYEVRNIARGKHHVYISYIGYSSLDTIVAITGNQRLDAVLKPSSTQLKEVVLTQNSTITNGTVHEDRVKTETMEKYSDASLGDALKEIAGVSVLKTGSSIVKPVINGLHSSRVPVISDNVRLEDQEWGTEHAPNLDINAAGKIAVIKGANALQYSGDAIGGLVLVEPRWVQQDTLMGKTILTLNSNGRGGALATSLNKGNDKGWAWNADATYKYMGDRQAPDYIISNTGNREANISGAVKYIANRYNVTASYSFYDATIGIALASHVEATADLVRAINSSEPTVIKPFTHDINNPQQNVQHHLAKIDFSTRLGENSTLTAQYAFQLNHRKEFDIRKGQYANIPALDLTLTTHSAKADWKHEKDNTTLKAGINFSDQHNNADPATGVRRLIPDYDKYDGGAYGIATYAFSNSFSAEAGIRYDYSHVDAKKFYQKTRWTDLGYDGVYDNIIIADYDSQWLTNPVFTYNSVSGSLGVRKELGSQYELLANAGLAMRNPNPSELFSDGLHHSTGIIELGNLGMQKEKGIKVSATLLKNGDRFSFNVNPYINSIDNFTFLTPTNIEYTNRGVFPVYRYRQTNALLTGIDLHTHLYFAQKWEHTLNVAYVNGRDVSNHQPLIDMPPLNISNSLRYTLKDWHAFYLELQNEIVCKQNNYPDNNFYADVPQDGQIVSTYVDISTPPAGYTLLHFNSGMQFKMGKTLASVTFSVYNIFNTTYRDYLNRQRLYTDEPGRNFQLQLKLNY